MMITTAVVDSCLVMCTVAFDNTYVSHLRILHNRHLQLCDSTLLSVRYIASVAAMLFNDLDASGMFMHLAVELSAGG